VWDIFHVAKLDPRVEASEPALLAISGYVVNNKDKKGMYIFTVQRSFAWPSREKVPLAYSRLPAFMIKQ
jgi:hypothetical protein